MADTIVVEQAAKLQDALLKKLIPEKDVEFVTSLVNSVAQKTVTPGRAKWIGIMAARVSGTFRERVVGDFSGVYNLFQKATTHLKRPRIVLCPEDKRFVTLYLAGPQSKQPGVVNVKDTYGDAEGNQTWYGRVGADGKWTPSNRLHPRDYARLPMLEALLKRLAADPAKTAAEHGKLTGSCCFCNRKLEDARSTAVGYGPSCAKQFGLPWGKQ